MLALAEELQTRARSLCSHGDVIPDLLEALVARGTKLKDELRWQKASTWVLTWDGDPWPRAGTSPAPDPGRGGGRRGGGEDGVDLLRMPAVSSSMAGGRVEGLEPVELVGRLLDEPAPEEHHGEEGGRVGYSRRRWRHRSAT